MHQRSLFSSLECNLLEAPRPFTIVSVPSLPLSLGTQAETLDRVSPSANAFLLPRTLGYSFFPLESPSGVLTTFPAIQHFKEHNMQQLLRFSTSFPPVELSKAVRYLCAATLRESCDINDLNAAQPATFFSLQNSFANQLLLCCGILGTLLSPDQTHSSLFPGGVERGKACGAGRS